MAGNRTEDSTPSALSTALRRSPRSAVSSSPQTIWAGYGPRGQSLEVEALLLRRQLEAAHDLQERPASVAHLQQVVIGVGLLAGDRVPVRDTDLSEERGVHVAVHRAQPELADAADREGVHLPGPVEGGDVDQGVESGQRTDPLGAANRNLEADRAADVVDDQVIAVDTEGVDRRRGPARQPAPGVIEGLGPVGEAEARQVEGNSPQPSGRRARAGPCATETSWPEPRGAGLRALRRPLLARSLRCLRLRICGPPPDELRSLPEKS